MDRLTGQPTASFGFPKTARLLRPSQFRRVQLEGRTVDLGALVVRVAQRPVSAPPAVLEARLGLAVSKRAGNAVARNRIKRRTREWFRHHRGCLLGLDVVVSARPQAAELDQPAVEALFLRLLERLGRT